MAISPETGRTTTAAFDRVLDVIDRSPASGAIPADARREARANAQAVLRTCGGADGGLTVALVGYAAELLGSAAAGLAADQPATRRLTDELQADAAVPRVALSREMLRAGRLLEPGIDFTIEVQLSLLMAFTGAEAICLWARDAAGGPTLVAAVGVADGAQRRAATTLLTRDRGGLVAGERTLALTVDVLGPPVAALVASGVDPAAAQNGVLLTAAAPTLAGLLVRRTPLGGEQSHGSVTGAVERRLARLRFDLHDGPQQDVYLLAQDLRLFRDQLRPMLVGDPDRERALGGLDDLEAQLMALDHDLRRLSTTVQSPFLVADSLHEALDQLTEAHAQRTGITPQTDFTGDLTRLSESQQITLLSLIREALSNARKHSDAHTVSIVIVSEGGGVTVQVSDDGSGFDPATTLAGSARAGRLGLVGMHERVRMLGGRTEIDSRPGGPTVISATLPPWPSREI
jgi:signal transduction histidine kinase